ncbi:MAG: hypothetical protein A2Y04_05345 [Omnitrophica WOR_2 bacterium GWC2_45_7]|nr:MAG: hypothetical protein A2Y04_05345 [Omnitrophica WOR_2 bacterium GWC2_45_7]
MSFVLIASANACVNSGALDSPCALIDDRGKNSVIIEINIALLGLIAHLFHFNTKAFKEFYQESELKITFFGSFYNMYFYSIEIYPLIGMLFYEKKWVQ